MLNTINTNITEALKYNTFVGADQIDKNEDNYSLEGKIAPRVHNEGEVDVIILNVTVKPGEMFNLSATPIPMSGNIPIHFNESQAGIKKLVVMYNTIKLKKDC